MLMRFFCFLFFTFSFLIRAEAQTTTVPSVSVYQFFAIDGAYKEKPKGKYQILKPFIKTDTGWVANNIYNEKESFYLVNNGKSGKQITGYKYIDSSYFFPGAAEYYKPRKIIKLSDACCNKQFDRNADTRMSKISLLSSNKNLQQRSVFKKYIPSEDETKAVLNVFKPYLRSLYQQRACRRNSMLTDSVINSILSKDTVFIDSANCLKDANNNRLITVKYPVYFWYTGIYPFDKYCFREDNRGGGFRFTYLMNDKDSLVFIHDELTYLANVDFDNDGKDEFVFWYSIFNNEGYVLYYDNFTKSSEYTWSYH